MNTNNRKLRWLRSRWSVAIALLLLAGIAGTWAGVRVWRAGKQREAVAAILADGGRVTYDYQKEGKASPAAPAWLRRLVGDDVFAHVVSAQVVGNTDLAFLEDLPSLEELDLAAAVFEEGELRRVAGLSRLRKLDVSNSSISNEGLKQLVALPRLEELSLAGSAIGDDELRTLKGFTQLRILDLGNSGIGGRDLKRLHGLPQLQELRLAGLRGSDAGLKYLKGLTQLEKLDLSDSDVTDAGLRHLEGLVQMRELNLARTGITDEGLKHLKPLTQLRVLGLQATKLSGADLRDLKGMTQLQELDLANTPTTNVCLVDLTGLMNLRILDVRGTYVTSDGIKRLKRVKGLEDLDVAIDHENVEDMEPEPADVPGPPPAAVSGRPDDPFSSTEDTIGLPRPESYAPGARPRPSTYTLPRALGKALVAAVAQLGDKPPAPKPVYGGTRYVAPRPTPVTNALRWLARQQSADGSWRFDAARGDREGHANSGTWTSQGGATGLALLPYLAAGQTHKSKVEFRENVAAAINWLIAHQRANGDLSAGGSPQVFSHAVATLALCEAYGLTADKNIGRSAGWALQFLVSLQDKESGGWAEGPGKPPSLRLSTWSILAMKSGEMAGLSGQTAVCDRAFEFLDSAKAENGPGYRDAGGDGANAATAAGVLCETLDQRATKATLQSRLQPGIALLTQADPSRTDAIYNLHATAAIAADRNAAWQAWKNKMRKQLEETQVSEGPEAGSWWNPDDFHAAPGGRLLLTAVNTLILEVEYRYLPIFKGP